MRQICFVSTAASLKSYILPCQEAGGLLTREREALRRTLAVAPLRELKPEIIFTASDYASVQTAEIIACRLDLTGPVVISPLLGETPESIHFNRLLFLHARMQSLLFVLPSAGIHALESRLVGQVLSPDIGPAEILALELSGRRKQSPARLLWRTQEGRLIMPLPAEPTKNEALASHSADFAEVP